MDVAKKKELLDDRLEDAGIEDFYAHELGRLTNGSWDGPDFDLPEPGMLTNIIPALSLVQPVRDILGPIEVVSAWRPPEYNELIGGSPTSRHKQFRAVDFRPANPSVSWAEFLGVVNGVVHSAISTASIIRGYDTKFGFLAYPESGFIHIDGGGREDHLIKRMQDG